MKHTLEDIEKKVDRDKNSLNLSRRLLSKSKLARADILLVCNYLKDNPDITVLSLRNNFIDDEGAKLLAMNTTLTTLGVSNNTIGVKGAKALFDVIRDHIGSVGAISLVESSHVSILDITSIDFNNKAVKIFIDVLRNNFNLNALYHSISETSSSETINKILIRNKMLPWIPSIRHARLMAQSQRSENCPMGTLPVELLGHINDFAMSANHFSFFNKQFDKRPAAQDIIDVKEIALL